MYKQQSNNNAGFTLIEVLVTLVIFAVGILGLAMMQLSAIKGNTAAHQATEATLFGSDQIERILSWDYDHANLNSSNDNVYVLPNGEDYTADGNQAYAGGYYNAYWQVSDDTPQTDSKTIDVTVIWQRQGVQKTLSLSTVKVR